MFLLSAQKGACIQRKLKLCLIPVGVTILVAGIGLGCAPIIKQEVPRLSGTFSGSTPEGHPFKVSLIQEKNVVTGRGLMGERGFSLSAITSQHGPVILTFTDGSTTPGYITLSPDGNTATFRGMGFPLALNRGGEPLRAPSGPFAGQYVNLGPPLLRLSLTQGGDLLAGTGFMDGRPMAVVGKVTGPNRVSGTILFPDESQNGVKMTLSDDGRTLKIHGLGGPIEMGRD